MEGLSKETVKEWEVQINKKYNKINRIRQGKVDLPNKILTFDSDFNAGWTSKTTQAGLKKGNTIKWVDNEESKDGIYRGQTLNDKRHGYGKNESPDQTEYMGQYTNGEFDGVGQYTWGGRRTQDVTVEKYLGEWVQGSRQGKGKWNGPNYEKYKGDFADGVFHGYGKFIQPSGIGNNEYLG